MTRVVDNGMLFQVLIGRRGLIPSFSDLNDGLDADPIRCKLFPLVRIDCFIFENQHVSDFDGH